MTRLNYLDYTSAARTFGPGYFRHFASVLDPRHIGTRPKGGTFGLSCKGTRAIEGLFCFGYMRTEAIFTHQLQCCFHPLRHQPATTHKTAASPARSPPWNHRSRTQKRSSNTFIATHLRQHTTVPPCSTAPVTAHLTMTTTTSEPTTTTTFTMRKTTGQSPWSRAEGSQCHRRRSRQRHPQLRRLHPRSGERRWRLRWMRECRSIWIVYRGLAAAEPLFAVERRVGPVWFRCLTQ